MGGRKSSSYSNVVGKSGEMTRRKREIINSIRSGDIKKVSQSTIDTFTKSDKVIDNLYRATKFLTFIEKNKKGLENYENRKKLASKGWSEIKKKEKLEPKPEIDRILISSATKAIKRGWKK